MMMRRTKAVTFACLGYEQKGCLWIKDKHKGFVGVRYPKKEMDGSLGVLQVFKGECKGCLVQKEELVYRKKYDIMGVNS